MKRALLAIIVAALTFSSTGCLQHNLARNGRGCNCQSDCPDGCRGGCRGGACGPGRYGYAAGGGDGSACRTCGRGLAGRPGGPCNYDPSAHYSDGGQSGMAAAQVAYPYYTVRGPRDFFLNNPPSIGR